MMALVCEAPQPLRPGMAGYDAADGDDLSLMYSVGVKTRHDRLVQALAWLAGSSSGAVSDLHSSKL